MIDYQWPSSFIKKTENKYKNSKRKNSLFLKEIENFFEEKVGFPCLLFPSARASISAIIRYLKFDRSKLLYVDKFSSHCLFNTIGALTNVTSELKRSDLIIYNHKWGLKKNSKKNYKYSIEDSVDSIILDKSAMFPNNSKFEIFSLPKIIGSVQGGLIFTRDKNFIGFIKKEQKNNFNLGIYQSNQKFLDIKKRKDFNTWLYHETWNTYLDTNALQNIKNNLSNFELNKIIILQRLEKINELYKNNYYSEGRIGPIFPIKYALIKKSKKIENFFLIRHHARNLSNNQKFEKFLLIPLHFKISDAKFNFYLNLIKTNLKSQN